MTKHVNKGWSSSIDDRGYGPLTEEDYMRLMEGEGFRVALAKSYPLCFKVTKVSSFTYTKLTYSKIDSIIKTGLNVFKDVVEATHKVIYEAFDEISEKDRNDFLSEYRQRIEAAHVPVRINYSNLLNN